jgi:hypothetical protein
LVLLLLLILVAVGLAVLAPVFRGTDENEWSAREEHLAELDARKEAKYREIRDAEGDFRAGKLSSEDFRALDRALRRDAIAILEQIDREREARR